MRKSLWIILLLSIVKISQAHEPDLSSLMIYNQHERYFLAIKSSLAAFEGEVDYLYGKNAYKNAEMFQVLALKHFENNCFVVMNSDTLKFIHPTLIPGHETTLFAELSNIPEKINSINIKNNLFKDMPSNMCEIILAMKGHPPYQFVLNNENDHEVHLIKQNNEWKTVNTENAPFKTKTLLFTVVLCIVVTSVIVLAKKQFNNRIAKKLNPSLKSTKS